MAFDPKEQQPKKKFTIPKNVVYISSAVVAAVLVFSSGWAMGRGNFSFSSLKNASIGQKVANYAEVNEVVQALRENYDGTIEDTVLMDSIKQGAAKSAGDPYTEYFNVEDSKAFADELSGSFEGIGAELGKDGSNVVIISPIAGSPAEKAGLKPKDIIVEIDKQPATDITISEAVKRIRGKAGTDVHLTLARNGEKVDVTITRAQINVPSVKWEVKDGVGVLTISRFSDDTAKLTLQAANEFKAANVKGVVLDMRGNPGGLLDAAVKISSMWLENGKTILQEKRNGQVIKTYTASGVPVLKGVKTTILINGGSASASEITAGALHDNGVATLMGEKSYGKGSVQQILNMSLGGTLKVTVARWFTPNDKNIDKEGIAPDKEIKITPEDVKAGRDPQMEAALASVK